MARVVRILLFLAVAAAFESAAWASNYQGWVDQKDCSYLSLWAWNGTDDTALTVDVYDNGALLMSVAANQFRQDLLNAGIGNGYHGYKIATPYQLMDGKNHFISANVDGTTFYLILNNGNAVQCSGGVLGATGYTYYFKDTLASINTSNWTQNGSLSGGANGLTAPSGTSGSLISKLTVQGPSQTQYEVRTIVKLAASGGTYVSYLRATGNAVSSPTVTGTAYAIELQNPVVTGASCTATLASYVIVSGAKTLMQSTSIVCSSSTEIRAVLGSGGWFDTYVNGALAFGNFPSGSQLITSGQPGVGAYNTPAGNGITEADLGPLDNVAPSAVTSSSIQPMAFSNHVDVQWTGVVDDPNGTGVAQYSITRNGAWLFSTRDAAFRDTTAQASTTYNYAINVYDYHLNYSSTTSFTVTTPASGFIDPNRVGVKTLGTYWGGTGENIDVRSGNVNFSIPLLTAKTRGIGAGLGLVYNSQNWLQNSAGTWNLGGDSGYGFGWTMQFGSLLPVYSNYWTVAYYLFTDSTGATYNLDQNNAGVWSSKGSVYVYYDTSTGLLHFKNGSFWTLGCTSAGTEQDAGTMYPTLMEDSNGNQIQVSYFPGSGVSWNNSSARIDYILDVRAPNAAYYGVTYQFVYNTDSIPHLTSITNTIGTPESYKFAYAENQPLTSPAPSQIAFPNTTLLTGVTTAGINTTVQLTYTPWNSGLLWFALLPQGGHLAWDYTSAQYPDSIYQPEISGRYTAGGADGSGQIRYGFTFTNTGQSTIHSSAVLDDPDGKSEKAWFFQYDGTKPFGNLITKFENRNGQTPNVNGGTRHQYTWTTDSAGNSYIQNDLISEDMDLGSQTQRQTTQTRDGYGNLTQSQIFDYGNLSTPARTYANTYLHAQSGKTAYVNAYILDRLYQSTVTDGTNSTTLVTNTYDSGTLTNLSSPLLHDSGYSSASTTRGNLTGQTTPSATVSAGFDITGMALSSTTNGLGVAYTPDAATNSVPTAITPNSQTNLATSFGYTQSQIPNSVTGPNSATASSTFDTYGRLLTSTSVYGAVTNYAYVTTPPFTTTATTNGHWVETILDGLGRTVSTIKGYNNGSTPVSISEVDTHYGPCGCSPMGKIVAVSEPYSPGGTPGWTTYVYDGLGRTLSTTLPDNSLTGYSYSGNTTKVTDPTGIWKTYTANAMGNLTQVAEPDPALGTVTTAYAYDILNHLTTVTMPRGSTTQTRTFNYTAGTTVGIYLLSATNPENGTVTYVYNTDGTLQKKKDAKNQETVFTYDAYKRATKIHRGTFSGTWPSETFNPDANQETDFAYDNATGCTNGWGRLCSVTYTGTNGNTGTGKKPDAYGEAYTYTLPGEIATKQWSVTRDWVYNTNQHATASLSLQEGYTWDNEGKMSGVTYPVLKECGGTSCSSGGTVNGPTYTFGFDTLSRLNLMTRTDVAAVIVNNAVYNVADQLTSLGMPQGGNGAETRTYNSLFQLTNITQPGTRLHS